MRALIFAIGLAAVAAAPATAQSLAGVSDKETTIPFAGNGGIEEFRFGNGDVMFVRHRTNRWFRIVLNEGCLGGGFDRHPAARFEVGPDTRLDKSSKVRFLDPKRTCLINSIRASAPPPQVDSRSPVTLD